MRNIGGTTHDTKKIQESKLSTTNKTTNQPKKLPHFIVRGQDIQKFFHGWRYRMPWENRPIQHWSCLDYLALKPDQTGSKNTLFVSIKQLNTWETADFPFKKPKWSGLSELFRTKWF